jgi:hypothetical protein
MKENKSLLAKMGELIKAHFSAEEIAAMKESQKKLESEMAPKFSEANTIDGKKLSYEGELQVGTAIMVVDAAGLTPAPDAVHELEDGTKVTTVGGIVTMIEKEAHKDEVSALIAKFSAEKESLLAEIKGLKEVQLSTLKAFDKVFNTPINTESVEVKEFKDMTPAERYRASKG